MLPARMYTIGLDTTFEVDQFSKPRMRSEAELIKNTVLFILFTKPGEYPSLPYIGLDIQSLLYSFYDEINEVDLADEITAQCNALGRYFQNGTINIRKTRYRGQPSLMLHIEAANIDTMIAENKLPQQRFQIGITFDELNDLIYNVTEGR